MTRLIRLIPAALALSLTATLAACGDAKSELIAKCEENSSGEEAKSCACKLDKMWPEMTDKQKKIFKVMADLEPGKGAPRPNQKDITDRLTQEGLTQQDLMTEMMALAPKAMQAEADCSKGG